jgi:protein-L-isoaspartate(D-aspartate) O-methyltransferase
VTLLDSPVKDTGFAAARKAMVDSQLRTSGVTATGVVARMGSVARENFVPEGSKAVAYMDRAIPLGDGKFLASPLAQGMLLQEAAPQSDEAAVLVDGGSGYMAELLRPMVASLKVLKPQEALEAKRGGKKADLIIIDGAVEHIPEALAKMLADDGRLVTGLLATGVTRIAVGRKVGKKVALMPVSDIGIPRLPAFDIPKGWSF